MRIFTAQEVNQGSDGWWDLRRGIPTASGFDRIITPVKMKPSASADDYIAELVAQVAHPAEFAPGWLTEQFNKPPNHAIEEGVKRESESRAWLAMERDCHVEQVGFCLADNGLYGCSPDGLIVADSGSLDAALECKNPQLATQAKYLMSGELPSDYRVQCHGHLLVTGLARCTFLSYCPPLEPLLIDVRADEFTVRLREALDAFTARYLAVLDKLKLRGRFEQQRASILSHFPEGITA